MEPTPEDIGYTLPKAAGDWDPEQCCFVDGTLETGFRCAEGSNRSFDRKDELPKKDDPN